MYYSNAADEQRADRIMERRGELMDKHPDWNWLKAEDVATAEVDLADSMMRADNSDGAQDE